MVDSTFEIVNVVGSGVLPAELALEPLKEDLKGESWENEGPQPGLHLEFSEDGPMTTFYRSGKYIIRAESKDRLEEANLEVREEIERLGIIADAEDDTGFQISNFVGVSQLDVDNLKLSALAIGLGLENVEYEPEQFPALKYRTSEYSCTHLLFSNGKIVTAGANTREETLNAFESFKSELEEWI